ncbi:MAG TPA: hypothetical protein VE198_23440 [Actinoallomurus sp.]|nr:hypothetical protein [Actinoallomurus sp.]
MKRAPAGSSTAGASPGGRRLAEPPSYSLSQATDILAGPRDMTVRPYEDRIGGRRLGGAGDCLDPVRPRPYGIAHLLTVGQVE